MGQLFPGATFKKLLTWVQISQLFPEANVGELLTWAKNNYKWVNISGGGAACPTMPVGLVIVYLCFY